MDDEPHDDLAIALQDALVPPGVPVLPDIDIAARFVIPPGSVEASGTWFDAVVLDDGRVALVVGEVPGSGLTAAATMGQLSAVLRTSLLQHRRIDAALEAADVHARHHRDARGTSVVVALVDPGDGSVCYATAGHPAPVVTSNTGPSRQLDVTGGGPLGAEGPRTTRSHHLAGGELILLGCTTLVRSARLTGRPFPRHLDDLTVAGDHEATTAALVEPALHLGRSDAVSLVLAQRRDRPCPPLDHELPVSVSTVDEARSRLGSWLAGIGAPRMDAMTIVHAAIELVANAVEHAQAESSRIGATATMTASLTAEGQVVVDVVDHGVWRAPSHDISRGRGLAMAAGLVDTLEVTTDTSGTRARISQRLCRPVRIQRQGGPRPRTLVPSVVVDHTAPGAVSLRGAFGHDDVDRVGAELLLASRGGTCAIVVDLAGLTDLAAGGVRLLSDLLGDPTGVEAAAAVVLHAPLGSTAHDELERAGVPHHAA